MLFLSLLPSPNSHPTMKSAAAVIVAALSLMTQETLAIKCLQGSSYLTAEQTEPDSKQFRELMSMDVGNTQACAVYTMPCNATQNALCNVYKATTMKFYGGFPSLSSCQNSQNLGYGNATCTTTENGNAPTG